MRSTGSFWGDLLVAVLRGLMLVVFVIIWQLIKALFRYLKSKMTKDKHNDEDLY